MNRTFLDDTELDDSRTLTRKRSTLKVEDTSEPENRLKYTNVSQNEKINNTLINFMDIKRNTAIAEEKIFTKKPLAPGLEEIDEVIK